MKTLFELPDVVLHGICRRLPWEDVDNLRGVSTISMNWIDRNRKFLDRRPVKMELSTVRNTSNLFVLLLSWEGGSKRLILAQKTSEPEICVNEGFDDLFCSGTDTCYIVIPSIVTFLDSFMPLLLEKCRLKRLNLKRVCAEVLFWFTHFCAYPRTTVSEVHLFPSDDSLSGILNLLHVLRPSKLLLELRNGYFLEELLSDRSVASCSHLYLDINDHEDVTYNLQQKTLSNLRAVTLEIFQKIVIGSDCVAEILRQWTDGVRSFEGEWTLIIERNLLAESDVFRGLKHSRKTFQSSGGQPIQYFEVLRESGEILKVFWRNYVLLLNPTIEKMQQVTRLCR